MGREETTDFTDGHGWLSILILIVILILIEKFHLPNYEWFEHDKPQHLLHLSPLTTGRRRWRQLGGINHKKRAQRHIRLRRLADYGVTWREQLNMDRQDGQDLK